MKIKILAIFHAIFENMFYYHPIAVKDNLTNAKINKLYYLINNNSLYFGSVHIRSSTISSSLSI